MAASLLKVGMNVDIQRSDGKFLDVLVFKISAFVVRVVTALPFHGNIYPNVVYCIAYP